MGKLQSLKQVKQRVQKLLEEASQVPVEVPSRLAETNEQSQQEADKVRVEYMTKCPHVMAYLKEWQIH